VTPAFEGVELGIGEALLKKAIMDTTGRSRDAIDILYKEKGDLGIVALEARKAQVCFYCLLRSPSCLWQKRTNVRRMGNGTAQKANTLWVQACRVDIE